MLSPFGWPASRQQLARRRRIGLGNDDVPGEEGRCRRDRADGGRALAEQREIDHVALVHRKLERAPDAHVVERRDQVVHDRRVPGAGRDALDAQARIGGERLHFVERQVPDDVDVAGSECGDLHARLGDDADHHAVELGKAVLEIIGIPDQDHPVPGRVALEHERPGADRVARQVGDEVARRDLRLTVRQDVGEAAVRVRKIERHRVGVRRRDVRDHRVVAARGRRAGRVGDPLEEGDDVVGHQFAAVVELHAPAQVERPALEIVRMRPGLRQVGLGGQVLADAGQAVEHQVGVDVFVAARGLHGIEGDDRGADRHAERSGSGPGRRRPDRLGREQRGASQQAPTRELHAAFSLCFALVVTSLRRDGGTILVRPAAST